MRKVSLFLASATVLAMFFTLPATADHAFGLGHWGNGYAPVVSHNWNDGGTDANVSDGAYYWQDTGFVQGYNPPLPRYEPNFCGYRTGWIITCTVSSADSRLQGYEGIAYPYYYVDGTGHIAGMQVFGADNMSLYRRQQVWRHEMGHAIGLDHTGDGGCVMRADGNVVPGTRCQHDIDAVYSMYTAHRD